MLYRNFHECAGKIYLIEISRNSKKVFIVLFENFEEPHNHIATALTTKVAYKLLNDNENLFEKLIGQFFIKFGKLQIGGYHGAKRPYIETPKPPDEVPLPLQEA